MSKKNPWTHEQRASGANVRGVCSTAKVSAVTPSVLWRTAAVVRACAVPHAVPERRRVCRVGLTAQSDADVARGAGRPRPASLSCVSQKFVWSQKSMFLQSALQQLYSAQSSQLTGGSPRFRNLLGVTGAPNSAGYSASGSS